jgi:hypothetical protein
VAQPLSVAAGGCALLPPPPLPSAAAQAASPQSAPHRQSSSESPPPLPQWVFLSWYCYGGVGACGFINDLFFATCSCGRPRAFEPPLLLGDPAVLDGTSASGSGSGAAAAPTPAPKRTSLPALARAFTGTITFPTTAWIGSNGAAHRACLRTAGWRSDMYATILQYRV